MPDSLDTHTIFQELDTLQARFGPRFILGLSGGGDSLALAHLCAKWMQTGGAQITALIVDHGFREGSTQEAIQAQQWATSFGLKAIIHTYQGCKPASRLQERARQLRHDAFTRLAFEQGGATVLLGHTLDDQAETIAFRLTRQTGLDGLAGIARVTTDLLRWHEHSFPIARPLLSVRRAALRAYLTQIGQSWIDDPSNENTDFARVNIRKRLDILGQHECLARIGALARSQRDALDQAVEDFLSGHTEITVSGVMAVNVAKLLDLAPCLQARILGRLIIKVAPQKFPLATEKLNAVLTNLRQPVVKRRTLGGALIEIKNGKLSVVTAPPRRTTFINTHL